MNLETSISILFPTSLIWVDSRESTDIGQRENKTKQIIKTKPKKQTKTKQYNC